MFNENIKPIEYDITNDVYLIRKHIYEFIIKDINEYWGRVLEIGPMSYEYTPVKRFYLNTKSILESRGNIYTSLDIDKTSNADIKADFLKFASIRDYRQYDAIICLDVLEHVNHFWEWPGAFHKLLKQYGKVFVSTPFYFRTHEPKPDYWRFTEEGLKAIFEPYFSVETDSIYVFEDSKKPLHINLIGTKYDRY